MSTPAPNPNGLSALEVAKLRKECGYNELPERHHNLGLLYLQNFWGPLPWMLELTIVITFLSGRDTEGFVIAVLLLINSGINLYQRQSADKALAILKRNLQILARVRRDGAWASLPARELLPGDIIRLRAGDIIPADAELIDGDLSIDLSSLTGESLPRDFSDEAKVFSGSIIRRGEASAAVQAIGGKTKYGLTTQLLEVSHPPTHMEGIIFAIIKYFFIANTVLAAAVTIFGLAVHAPAVEITNFVIVLLLTSVPVAFPTMFAVAQNYGALLLSRQTGQGVLVRRLAAVQEGAMMDVLCSDKTGTLTQNSLSVQAITHYGSPSDNEVLQLAAAASDEADEDSIDRAILRLAENRHLSVPARVSFRPFDPATKCTEAVIRQSHGQLYIKKGLPELLLTAEGQFYTIAKQDLERLSAEGLRVVAVMAGTGADNLKCVGLIGLADPIRPDAPRLINELDALGIRVVMITGDGRVTAQAVATQLGITGAVITPDKLKSDPALAVHGAVFAETYPEDKLTIIRALQQAGHTVGMTGDGVNDAPALRQAEVGIAVANATDVAKQSASLILTAPGLGGVKQAVLVGRGVYVRLRTWALNKVIKSIEVSVLTTIIFFAIHSYILSPMLAVLLMLANDFVTISIATDNVEPIAGPVRWNVARLVSAAAIMALVPLCGVFLTYLVAHHLGYSLGVTRTVIYIALVYYGKATLLAIRSWPHAWSVIPSKMLMRALVASFLLAFLVATSGIIVPAVPLVFMALVIIGAAVSFWLVDRLKASRLVRRLLGEI